MGAQLARDTHNERYGWDYQVHEREREGLSLKRHPFLYMFRILLREHVRKNSRCILLVVVVVFIHIFLFISPQEL